MDSIKNTATTTAMEIEEEAIIKSNKRVCDDDDNEWSRKDGANGQDANNDSTVAEVVDVKPTKRFKVNSIAGGAANTTKSTTTPQMGSAPVAGRSNNIHGKFVGMVNTLTPISEISDYMSATNLCDTPTGVHRKITPKLKALNFDSDCLDDNANAGTPEKSAKKKLQLQNFQNLLSTTDEDGSSANNENKPEKRANLADDKAKPTEGYTTATTTTVRRSFSGRRLNMDTSAMTDMVIDDLSFYDDDSTSASAAASAQAATAQQRSFTASPRLMSLLSPESSPQRFQIFAKPGNKFIQNATASSCTHSAAPPTTMPVEPSANSKNLRMFHSLSSGSVESSMDDDYMELFEMESLEQQMNASNPLNFPSNLNSLISGQIKSSTTTATSSSVAATAGSALIGTPEMRRPSVRRCLSMTENNNNQTPPPKTPEFLKKVQEQQISSAINTPTNACFKRPEPPTSTTCSPIQSKRYRGGDEKENLDGSLTALIGQGKGGMPAAAAATVASGNRPILRKCISMNDAEIMTALARSENKDEPDLIGDFSKPFALPLMDGRHRDLKSVSSDTVARLLNGAFDDNVASYKIIDCRYPYEFEGGHIRGAKNLYTQEQIMEEFLTLQKTEQHQALNDASGPKRNIIIFHCEFSSERGPKLSRFLRNTDRARNTNSYPSLDYPEIYLLHNGYKEFYETHADLCDPIAYRPMLEPSYSEEYRHFRAKSKSWNGDGLGGGTTRLKKSRSRLML